MRLLRASISPKVYVGACRIRAPTVSRRPMRERSKSWREIHRGNLLAARLLCERQQGRPTRNAIEVRATGADGVHRATLRRPPGT